MKIRKDKEGAHMLSLWNDFLNKVGKSEREIAKELGYAQQNLNDKKRRNSMKLSEFRQIVERYGYSISIHKKKEE